MNSIFAFFLGSGVATTIFIYYICHPEKIEKWASMFFWCASHVWKGAEYHAIKSEIQGKMNSFVGTLESKTTTQFPRISIKWAGREKEELIWEDGEVIIVMRDKKNKMKNFIHAAYFFTSEALLKKSKRHLSKTQKTSLDLFATKKILESQSIASVEQFMNDYFIPNIEKNEELGKLIQKYIHVDRIGIFFPILIQELSFLGNKVFLSKPTAEVIQEVKRLIDFLEKFSEREVGDDKFPEVFSGEYTRCAIKIVAKRVTIEIGDIASQKERINNAIKKGFENIYMIGSDSDKNRKFMDEVFEVVCKENQQIKLLRPYNFKGQIKLGGEFVNVRTYLITLHNPNAVKYFYEQNDVDSLV